MSSSVLRDIAGPLAACLLVAMVVAITTPTFADFGNLNNLVLQVSIVASWRSGSTMVILSGGIDLSPGSAVALITVVLASAVKFWGVPFWLAVLLALLIGLVLGLVNGVLTAYLRIPSFITTLAALSAFRGIAFMFNNGSPVFQVSPLAGADLLRHGWRACRCRCSMSSSATALAFWFLRYTALGRSIYAVGGNANAARLSGINVAASSSSPSSSPGSAAALGAVLMAARLNSGSPNYGVGLELVGHRRRRDRRGQPCRRARQSSSTPSSAR